jgi:peptidoglycan/LPS O-acetylase OafA/YrhL
MAAPSPSSAAEGVRAEVGDIRAIEGLRGIAVLWVVAFHYLVLREGRFDDAFVALVNGLAPVQALVRNGYLGVDLFFLITGFLLTLPWFKHAREGRGAPSARAFYVRRLRRIVPAYYVQLALLAAVFLPLLVSWRFVKAEFPFVLANLAAHASFLHYTTPLTSASFSINGALWTLALEFQFYLLLPLVAPLFVRRPLAAAAVFVAIALAWRLAAAHAFGAWVDWYSAMAARWQVPEAALRSLIATQLPGYLAHFAAGILCGRAWLMARGRPASRTRDAALALVAFAFAAGLWAVLGFGLAPLGELSWLVHPFLLGGAMAASVSARPTWSDAVLATRPLAWVGRVSYSTYLYHMPLVLLMGKLLPGFGGWAAMPAYLAALMAVSWLSWRFVERPFLARRSAVSP